MVKQAALIRHRNVINGKADKAPALHKLSDTLTPSQPGITDYAHPIALPHLKSFPDYAPEIGYTFTQPWRMKGFLDLFSYRQGSRFAGDLPVNRC